MGDRTPLRGYAELKVMTVPPEPCWRRLLGLLVTPVKDLSGGYVRVGRFCVSDLREHEAVEKVETHPPQEVVLY